MPLESLVARARYMAIVLPIFALFTTVHAGCNLAPQGNYYGNYRSSASASTACVDDDGVSERSEDDAEPCAPDDGDAYEVDASSVRDR